MFMGSNTSEADEPTGEGSYVPIKSEPHKVTAPAQEWEEWAALCCAMRLAEAKTGDVINVPAREHGGFLYAVFSVTYGGFSGEYVAYAWQLVPSALFNGTPWTYVSGYDFEEGVRKRGDNTGMLVSVRGSELVCAKRVQFVRDLPTVAPITGRQACNHEAEASRYGWRAMRFKGVTPQWGLLQRHPVAVYVNPTTGDRAAVLLWTHKGVIQDLYLGHREEALQMLDGDLLDEGNSMYSLGSPGLNPEMQGTLF